MGDAFDAREARRAFSWINGIGMSGAIAGGFLPYIAMDLVKAAIAAKVLPLAWTLIGKSDR